MRVSCWFMSALVPMIPATALVEAASGTYRFISSFLVKEAQGPRITDIDAGGNCVFCPSGSLRAPSLIRSPPIPSQGQRSARGWGNRVLA